MSSITGQVPDGYEAYVRIFHEVRDQDDNPVTWGEVAAALGTVAHPEMQWHTIVGSRDPFNFTGSNWTGTNPFTGELELPGLDELCEILSAHSADPDRVCFGLSTITSWEIDVGPEELAGKSLLHLPGREYVVLSGRLADVDQIARASSTPGSGRMISVQVTRDEDAAQAIQHAMTWREREAPNLIWPEERSWFMLSEADWDSTVLGGSAALTDAIVAAPGLDAWPVKAAVCLSYGADTINGMPPTD